MFKIIAILYVGAYIIWEAPARNILLVGKKACAEQYRKIIAGLGEIISMEFLNRYAVEDRVFDDRIFIIKLLKGNVWGAVPNKQVRMRLAHSFQIRDGLICKEIAYEMLSEP